MNRRRFIQMIAGLTASIPVLGKAWASSAASAITTDMFIPSDTKPAAFSSDESVAARLHSPGNPVKPFSQNTPALRDLPWSDPQLQPASGKARDRILIQRSPIAGFQYHVGEQIWPQLKPRQALRLKREPDN